MPEYDNCDLHWTVDISGYRQLFVDNMVVARMENCIKRLHLFKKVSDRPVIRPEYDWEKYATKHESPHPLEAALGTKLDGVVQPFTKERCIAVTGNQLDATINWGSNPDLALYGNKLVAIKFYLKKASLYSFWFE